MLITTILLHVFSDHFSFYLHALQGWIGSAGLIFALVPGLNFLSSLAVAACLTPTDPILAAAVVGGKYADKHVPAHLRHLLAAESGCNDGAAFPFLYFALYLVTENSTKHAIQDWFLITWFCQFISFFLLILRVILMALIFWLVQMKFFLELSLALLLASLSDTS